MQVESNQLVLKTDCGIFVDRQRNCCAAASAAGGEHRKDKGVAILDYALGNRPSTGGEVGGRLCPQRARRQLVPVIEGVRSRAAEAGVARSGSHLPGRALQ